tara:strand:- start:28629 stop:30413 length:1785 start_codon:yes stop_codon:yes gene_type:complete
MRSETESALGYGNVNIYKGEEKVASVLTDADGNFDVKLDTGLYRVEVEYVGYEPIIDEVNVLDDAKADFKLKADKDYMAQKAKRKIAKEEAYSEDRERMLMFSDAVEVSESKRTETRVMGSTHLKEAPMTEGDFLPVELSDRLGSAQEGKSGVLTAGEINDFSKWEMWSDIVTDKLSEYQAFWKIEPKYRYTVQLTNQDQLPVVDATVQLIDEGGAVLYQSRTDNTGKAELWGSLTLGAPEVGNCSAQIYHEGKEFHIRKLVPFKEGINRKSINVNCEQSKVVDIAFVVDATGSMSDEINFLRKELNDVIFKTKNANPELTFNFANTFYRDQNEEYLTKHQDFSDVLSKSIDFISEQNARGGGDYEEAVEVALDEAINDLNWSDDARSRILFLILDAPPHNSPEILTKLDAIMRQAAAQGIRIIPLVASGINKDAEYLLRSMALATNGTYAFLTDHSGIGGSHIEPTTDEYEVELLNDLMIRLISSYIYLPDCSDPVNEDDLEEYVHDDSNDDKEDKLEWTIWPNPTSGIVNIKIDRDMEEVFLTDLSGKIMERYTDLRKNRALKRDLSQYARGLYLITFTYKEKVYTKKVVLQ